MYEIWKLIKLQWKRTDLWKRKIQKMYHKFLIIFQENISIINVGNIGDVADWKINDVLEYFRYMSIAKHKNHYSFLLISTMVFTE